MSKQFQVLYQGEAKTFRIREPETTFEQGRLYKNVSADAASAVRGEPGFVVEEMEEEPAPEPKKEKVK